MVGRTHESRAGIRSGEARAVTDNQEAADSCSWIGGACGSRHDVVGFIAPVASDLVVCVMRSQFRGINRVTQG